MKKWIRTGLSPILDSLPWSVFGLIYNGGDETGSWAPGQGRDLSYVLAVEQEERFHGLEPELLKDYFKALRIESYEEVTDFGDWGGPPSRLVRMIARKQ